MADCKEELRLVVGAVGEEEIECGGEEERLLEGMSALNFDMLCSTVAMQSQGKWRILENEGEGLGGSTDKFGGVLRMWEGELHDCFDDRRIAIETLCCPCYSFGKNMKRAGLGSSFIQGAAYVMLVLLAVVNFFAFLVSRRHCFLYLAIALTISLGTYSGFLRTRMRKKFNIRGNDSYLDDCIYHLTCPCCSICQEARTLEMNNVQDGTWHGRGDTICIGSFSARNRTFFELCPPAPMSIKPSNTSSTQKNEDVSDPL